MPIGVFRVLIWTCWLWGAISWFGRTSRSLTRKRADAICSNSNWTEFSRATGLAGRAEKPLQPMKATLRVLGTIGLVEDLLVQGQILLRDSFRAESLDVFKPALNQFTAKCGIVHNALNSGANRFCIAGINQACPAAGDVRHRRTIAGDERPPDRLGLDDGQSKAFVQRRKHDQIGLLVLTGHLLHRQKDVVLVVDACLLELAANVVVDWPDDHQRARHSGQRRDQPCQVLMWGRSHVENPRSLSVKRP